MKSDRGGRGAGQDGWPKVKGKNSDLMGANSPKGEATKGRANRRPASNFPHGPGLRASGK